MSSSPRIACGVVNAGQFGVIKAPVSKTDRNDARALARFLGKGLRPSPRVKGELRAQVNSLANRKLKRNEDGGAARYPRP